MNAYSTRPSSQSRKKRHLAKPLMALALLVVLVGAGIYISNRPSRADSPTKSAATSSGGPTAATSTSAGSAAVNYCASNTETKLILVSISKQHVWACDGTTSENDFPVITGMEIYPADLTPPGTYHIYAKAVNQTLAGSDSTGSWSDFVNYWMPFLDNKYGAYGFHDLTQQANGANGRADSDFGNVNINLPYTAAKHGSHGCVETPFTAMKWLYNWTPVGTTVTVQS